jgi:hypothetical protein
MQNIVLITRNNGEQVTGVSVFLCNPYEEARLFCRLANGLSLAEGENILARYIKMGKGYTALPIRLSTPLKGCTVTSWKRLSETCRNTWKKKS